ncbi:MAG: UvrB/UvrC motif-containing protein [bacterium]
MLCEDCNERVATVVYTEVREGSKHTLHLCQSCVAARGIKTPVMKSPLQPDALFQGLLTHYQDEEALPLGEHPMDARRCPACDGSFQAFRETGRLGCPECYGAFEEELKTLMRRLHGTVEHLGRMYEAPQRGVEEETDPVLIRRALDRAVASEEFERAARLRDRLHRLEEGGR